PPHLRTSGQHFADRAACAQPVPGVDSLSSAIAEVSHLFPHCSMEANTPQKDPIPVSDAPLNVFREEDVSASVFARPRRAKGQSVTYYSVSFSRSYVDASGVRKYTKSFDFGDLGK